MNARDTDCSKFYIYLLKKTFTILKILEYSQENIWGGVSF